MNLLHYKFRLNSETNFNSRFDIFLKLSASNARTKIINLHYFASNKTDIEIYYYNIKYQITKHFHLNN